MLTLIPQTCKGTFLRNVTLLCSSGSSGRGGEGAGGRGWETWSDVDFWGSSGNSIYCSYWMMVNIKEKFCLRIRFASAQYKCMLLPAKYVACWKVMLWSCLSVNLSFQGRVTMWQLPMIRLVSQRQPWNPIPPPHGHLGPPVFRMGTPALTHGPTQTFSL